MGCKQKQNLFLSKKDKKQRKTTLKQMKKHLTPHTLERLEEEGIIDPKAGNVQDLINILKKRKKHQNKEFKLSLGD